MTLFSWNTHDAWLLLEADPTVRAFCERPAYVDGEAGRALDFRVDQGSGRAEFLVVSTEDTDAKSLAPSVHGVKLQVLRRPDMIAFARRIENWTQIVPHRTSFMRHTDRGLQNDLLARLEKPRRLERIEAAFHAVDVSVVRAALFDLLADGRVSAPTSISRRSDWTPYSGELLREAAHAGTPRHFRLAARGRQCARGEGEALLPTARGSRGAQIRTATSDWSITCKVSHIAARRTAGSVTWISS